VSGRADLPFLHGRLPPAFRRRVVLVDPDRPRPYDAAEWRGALVVVERGELALHCHRGGVRTFPTGAVLHLQDLTLRTLACPGPETTVLIAVDRRTPVPYRTIDLPDRPYLGIRATCTPDTMAVIADRIPGIIGRVLGAGVPVGGAPFLRYRVLAPDGGLDVEAGVPVDDPAPLAGDGLHAAVLPAGRYAVARHLGHLDGLVAATDALLAAVTADGLAWDVVQRPDGEHWGARVEHFLTDLRVEPDPARYETELAFRLAGD
jgi:effector-binding domain-containing protein